MMSLSSPSLNTTKIVWEQEVGLLLDVDGWRRAISRILSGSPLGLLAIYRPYIQWESAGILNP